MKYAQMSTSNRSDPLGPYGVIGSPIHREGQFSPVSDHDEEEEFFLFVLECDDFWWEEEDKHTLF